MLAVKLLSVSHDELRFNQAASTHPKPAGSRASSRSRSRDSRGEGRGAIKALSTLLVDFDIDPSKFFIMYNKTRHKTANWQ